MLPTISTRLIVVSPTDTWIRPAFAKCRKSVCIASPFVGSYMRDRVAELSFGVSVTLLTRTLLTDFASQASDLDAVCGIAARGSNIVSLNALHAKVYIIDEIRALITSANATFAGMNRNFECGYELKNPKLISELRRHFDDGFGARMRLKNWSHEELELLREPVALLRRALPRLPRVPSIADQPPLVKLKPGVFRELVSRFSGWLRLVLEGILILGKPEFTLNQIWEACAPLAMREFPNNRHPRAKLRQQLQKLRDLGVIRFLGDGTYELLTQPSR